MVDGCMLSVKEKFDTEVDRRGARASTDGRSEAGVLTWVLSSYSRSSCRFAKGEQRVLYVLLRVTCLARFHAQTTRLEENANKHQLQAFVPQDLFSLLATYMAASPRISWC